MASRTDKVKMKKTLKKFEKGLDNPLPLWYNKDTVREMIQIPYERSEQGHSPQVGRQ